MKPTTILGTSFLLFVGVYLFSHFSKKEGFVDSDEVQKILALIQQSVGKLRVAVKEKEESFTKTDRTKQDQMLSKIESNAASIKTWWMKQTPIQKSANLQILYSPQLQGLILDVNEFIKDYKLNVQPIPIKKNTESQTFVR